MTAEQLRDLYVRDIDDALDSWVLMRRLSEEQKRRLRAQRAFLMAADAGTLAAMKAAYEREPVRAEGIDDHQWVNCETCQGTGRNGRVACPACNGYGKIRVSGKGEQEDAEACGWRKGPLPKDTYNWGGVVPVGVELGYGFYFADFAGDHVKIDHVERNDAGVMVWSTKRLEADQVAWWNNCLELPTHFGAKRLGGDK
jgi:hypothetical protein